MNVKSFKIFFMIKNLRYLVLYFKFYNIPKFTVYRIWMCVWFGGKKEEEERNVF